MEEFNNFYNTTPQHFTTETPQPQQTPQSEPPKKKKGGKMKAVVAVVLAVMLIGGGAGFGGAYLGTALISDNSNSGSQNNDSTQTPSSTSAPAADSTTPKTTVNLDDALDKMVDASSGTALTAAELYEKVSDTIVIVNNYRNVTGSVGGKNNESNITLYGTGSGVVITTDGYIITNYHVVEGAAKVSIIIDDYDDPTKSEEIEATVIGSDSSSDLAILKVDRDAEFKAAALGDSDSLKVGQDVCAIGNPSNLEKTMTRGIISGLNRYSDSNGYALSSIQVDAAINPGNSGGGLFDMYGNVVGIVNAKIVSTYSENLGLAITINEAKPVISDLLTYGYVTGRPLLGISTVELNEYSAYLYGYSTTGLFVKSINEGAPVENSGLEVGDIITAINGTKVSTLDEVQTILKKFKAGDTVDVTVVRTNQMNRDETLTFTVELIESGE